MGAWIWLWNIIFVNICDFPNYCQLIGKITPHLRRVTVFCMICLMLVFYAHSKMETSQTESSERKDNTSQGIDAVDHSKKKKIEKKIKKNHRKESMERLRDDSVEHGKDPQPGLGHGGTKRLLGPRKDCRISYKSRSYCVIEIKHQCKCLSENPQWSSVVHTRDF